jgi:hypothetical protein
MYRLQGGGLEVNEFDVHDSVHLGNVYVRLRVQLVVRRLMCGLFSWIVFGRQVSGAIFTHLQEHKLQSTAIGIFNGYGMLIHWSRYWLGYSHTFSNVRYI